jgi:hypothetical protein
MTDHKGSQVQIWKKYENGSEFNDLDLKLLVLPTLEFMQLKNG